MDSRFAFKMWIQHFLSRVFLVSRFVFNIYFSVDFVSLGSGSMTVCRTPPLPQFPITHDGLTTVTDAVTGTFMLSRFASNSCVKMYFQDVYIQDACSRRAFKMCVRDFFSGCVLQSLFMICCQDLFRLEAPKRNSQHVTSPPRL